jgi:phage shock protein PspC (stress-responsive transcriptional regulator)
VLAGVAGGIGERLGVDPVVVRLAFVVLAFAGGFGVLLYLFGWLIGPEAPEGTEPRPAPGTETGVRQIVSVALVVAGGLLLLRTGGLWFGDAVVWPVALAAFGSAIIWTRTDESGRARWLRFASTLSGRPLDAAALGRPTRGRIAAGAVPIVNGTDSALGSSKDAEWLKFIYGVASGAKVFAQSWDQAMSPTAAETLLDNIAKLFQMSISPQQFATNLNAVIGT